MRTVEKERRRRAGLERHDAHAEQLAGDPQLPLHFPADGSKVCGGYGDTACSLGPMGAYGDTAYGDTACSLGGRCPRVARAYGDTACFLEGAYGDTACSLGGVIRE
ncbi:MAG: hypothetical protein KDA51_04080 [Planctomycetales bacterium]|nr:hypothetical protein [Planctomycetales bacterium]